MRSLLLLAGLALLPLLSSAQNAGVGYRMDGIEQTQVEIVWEPQWTPQLISAEGRKTMGLDDEEE